jgi:hypothetical protein
MYARLPHGVRRESLSGRGQLLKTFGAFGAFVALSLLAVGLYLIEEQFANPMQSSDGELIAGAVLLTTSLATFSAVLRPARKQPRKRIERGNQWEQPSLEMVGIRTQGRKAGEQERCNGPERYVDRAEIRLLAAPQARGMAGK